MRKSLNHIYHTEIILLLKNILIDPEILKKVMKKLLNHT